MERVTYTKADAEVNDKAIKTKFTENQLNIIRKKMTAIFKEVDAINTKAPMTAEALGDVFLHDHSTELRQYTIDKVYDIISDDVIKFAGDNGHPPTFIYNIDVLLGIIVEVLGSDIHTVLRVLRDAPDHLYIGVMVYGISTFHEMVNRYHELLASVIMCTETKLKLLGQLNEATANQYRSQLLGKNIGMLEHIMGLAGHEKLNIPPNIIQALKRLCDPDNQTDTPE